MPADFESRGSLCRMKIDEFVVTSISGGGTTTASGAPEVDSEIDSPPVFSKFLRALHIDSLLDDNKKIIEPTTTSFSSLADERAQKLFDAIFSKVKAGDENTESTEGSIDAEINEDIEDDDFDDFDDLDNCLLSRLSLTESQELQNPQEVYDAVRRIEDGFGSPEDCALATEVLHHMGFKLPEILDGESFTM